MLSVFSRVSQVITIIFMSFVLGAILAGVTAIQRPDIFNWIIDYAGDLKDWLSDGWLPLEVNVWFKILFKDESLVLMFFTIFARLIIYTLFGIWNWVVRAVRGPQETMDSMRAQIDELESTLASERQRLQTLGLPQ